MNRFMKTWVAGSSRACRPGDNLDLRHLTLFSYDFDVGRSVGLGWLLFLMSLVSLGPYVKL